MIDDHDSIIRLLDEVSSVLDVHVDLYMIGGGAMMFLGSKGYTKDLDVVVSNETEYHKMIDALSRIGFVSDRPTKGMDNTNLSDTQVRGVYRVDLFDRTVCGELRLSETMKERSVIRYESQTITLHSCSPEDIFLLKSVTEREGDISDCNNLIRLSEKFDWGSFLEELRIQMSFGEPIWITYVVERLLKMNFESRNPDVLKNVTQMEEDYLSRWADDFERRHDPNDSKSPK